MDDFFRSGGVAIRVFWTMLWSVAAVFFLWRASRSDEELQALSFYRLVVPVRASGTYRRLSDLFAGCFALLLVAAGLFPHLIPSFY